jgi:chemotaxis methyl-accepting protein methylase
VAVITLQATEPILDEVVARVRQAHGLDFAGYRRGTLLRRLAFRMVQVGARTGEAYLRTLRERPDEAARLAEQLTVKVSRFYRNAPMFDAVRRLLPGVADPAGAPLRLWSAGCGHGEEAYTLAMLLGDRPGEVCGSDVDGTALALARQGTYPTSMVAELPDELAHRWLEPTAGTTVRVREELRARVRFVRHDLTAEPEGPAPPYHLVCCRNVLIYLAPAVQQRVLGVLVRGLVPGGLLCLGEAEWISSLPSTLMLVDRKLRIFQRGPAYTGVS